MPRARPLLRVALGTAVSALFLALLLRQVDLAALGDAIARVRVAWLIAAAPVYTLALWTRAERWRLVLRPALALRSRDALAIVVIGYTANNLLPIRAGELVRAVLVQRRTGAARLTVLGTIVVERVLDGLVLALFLPLPLLLGGSNRGLDALAIIGGLGFLALAAVIVLLGTHPAVMRRLVDGTLARTPARLRLPVRAWSESFIAGLSLVRGRRAWAAVTAITALSWLLEAATYWCVGRAFGLGIAPWLYLGVAGAANLAIAAPSTAGGIGPFEYFARTVLVVFGAGVAAATAYALVLHALLIVPATLAGLALLWREQIGLGALRRDVATTAAPTAAPAHTGVAPATEERAR